MDFNYTYKQFGFDLTFQKQCSLPPDPSKTLTLLVMLSLK